jgi:hypothetical protein
VPREESANRGSQVQRVGQRTLIFPVAALDLFVVVLLDIALEDTCASRLVEAGGFENVGGVDPIVFSPAHHMFFQVGSELVFVDGDLPVRRLAAKEQERRIEDSRRYR